MRKRQPKLKGIMFEALIVTEALGKVSHMIRAQDEMGVSDRLARAYRRKPCIVLRIRAMQRY